MVPLHGKFIQPPTPSGACRSPGSAGRGAEGDHAVRVAQQRCRVPKLLTGIDPRTKPGRTMRKNIGLPLDPVDQLGGRRYSAGTHTCGLHRLAHYIDRCMRALAPAASSSAGCAGGHLTGRDGGAPVCSSAAPLGDADFPVPRCSLLAPASCFSARPAIAPGRPSPAPPLQQMIPKRSRTGRWRSLPGGGSQGHDHPQRHVEGEEAQSG